MTWYSRVSAIESHMTVSLLPASARTQAWAVPDSVRMIGGTLGSLVSSQRKYSTYVSESEPQSRFLVLHVSRTHMCHRPVPL